MIILGIDPGSTLIGYGVIESSSHDFSNLGFGTIETPEKDRSLAYLSAQKAMKALLGKYHPDCAAIEKLFFMKNKKTALAVSEMRGVLSLSIAEAGIPIFEFTPLEVKQAVCGYGMAQKDQVETVVRQILKIKQPIRPDDASDALAIAICCAVLPRDKAQSKNPPI